MKIETIHSLRPKMTHLASLMALLLACGCASSKGGGEAESGRDAAADNALDSEDSEDGESESDEDSEDGESEDGESDSDSEGDATEAEEAEDSDSTSPGRPDEETDGETDASDETDEVNVEATDEEEEGPGPMVSPPRPNPGPGPGPGGGDGGNEDPEEEEPEPSDPADSGTDSGEGMPMPPPEGGGEPSGDCIAADLLWFEDWETGDYDRWTSNTYNDDWGDGCQGNGFTNEHPNTGSAAHLSEITCEFGGIDDVHRGYGGLQFSGDTPMEEYTNEGVGLDAPFGLINTFHIWLESGTSFTNGTWVDFWTTESACDWTDNVLTVGLDQDHGMLAPAHWWGGNGDAAGSMEYAEDAEPLPLGEWVRITIYVNYHDGQMHLWQNGQSHSHTTFDRPKNTICQFHWGLYASGDNTDVRLYEDDNSLYKLQEPLTDFNSEPWLAGGSPAACSN